MLLIVFFLAVGFIIGRLDNLPVSDKVTQKLMLFGLIFLLIVMGAQLGANKKVLSDFGKMGLQAIALAVGGIFFSVLLVHSAEKILHKKLYQKHFNQSNKVGGEK